MKTIDHPHQTQQDDFLIGDINMHNIIIGMIIKNEINLNKFKSQLPLLSQDNINLIHVFLENKCKKEGLYCNFLSVLSEYMGVKTYKPKPKFKFG